MPEICHSIIDDFLAGVLSRQELEESLGSMFQRSPESSADSQNYIQQLYTQSRLEDEQYRMLSELISQITIHTTLQSNLADSDVSSSFFNEDNTLHLTEFTKSKLDQSNPSLEEPIIRSDSIAESAGDRDIDSMQAMDDAYFSAEVTLDSGNLQHTGKIANKNENLHPGTTLKKRFVLLERLGQGGMGIVFKAKDLLKVEAKDKNPYVAIKVLTDAFKKYSGSFIALQREASKAQRLAHPNIATVYDFDRDGDMVFMTMEFLQGKPLNHLIKELPQKPIKTEHALHIIEQLCHGLSFAHEKRLIHSDFKPAN